MRPPSNALATRALRLLLHGPDGVGNPTMLLLDYGDPATFQALWLNALDQHAFEFGERSVDWQNADAQILLIGNDPPDGVFDAKLPGLAGINFRSHFTATSWLAAWKVKFPDSEARFAVIDPRKAALASGAPRALQTILGARDPAGDTLVPRGAVLNSPSLESICQWLSASKADERPTPDHLLDLLRSTIWNELTSDRERHHALSNALGALLLSSQVGRGTLHPDKPWAQDYLLALVRALGLGAEQEMVPLDGQRNWISSGTQRKIGGAVLIDDMGDLWEYFLRGALGFTGTGVFGKTGRTFRENFGRFGRMDFAAAIQTLPERLESFMDSSRPRLCAQDLLGTSTKLGEDFTLFLDLRLFPGSRGEEERRFLAALAWFGHGVLDSDRYLPWIDGAGRLALRAELAAWHEVESVQGEAAVLDGSAISTQPPETLLPRLIALLDPTLPIVVFTSTHRTDLIDPFRNYGNIITTFRKPTIVGMDARRWEETVEELRAEFEEAMEESTAILRARAMLRPHAPGRSNALGGKSNAKAVEIFVDESILIDFDVKDDDGDTRKKSVMAIGAVACLARDHTTIEAFCRRLEEESLHWGLSITNRDEFIEEIRRPWADASTGRLECRRGWRINRMPEGFVWLGKKPNANEIADAAQRILTLATESGVELFAVSLSCDPDRTEGLSGRPELNWDPVSADEWHRELTRRLLQILFVGHPMVAAVLRRDGGSLALDLGDRIQEVTGGREACEDLFQAYGIRYTSQDLTELTREEEDDLRKRHSKNARMQAWEPKANAITVASDHALFALREALASLRSQTAQVTIERCRSAALVDFDDLINGPGSWLHRLSLFPPFAHQIHYLADWVARRASYAALWGDRQWEPLESLVDHGFHQHWRPRTQELLDLVLSGLEGRLSEAIAGIHTWTTRWPNPDPGERLLLARANSFAKRLDAEELRRLFSIATVALRTVPGG